MDTWGLARARVETAKDSPGSVVIDVQLLDQVHYPELYGAAFTLARRAGIVTIDRRININLPEAEGFRGWTRSGDIATAVEGYDPALSRVTDTWWTITIPLRSEEARAALLDGGAVVIDPNRNDEARTSLQGLAFQW